MTTSSESAGEESPPLPRPSTPTTGLRPFGDGLLPPTLAWPLVLGALIMLTGWILRPFWEAIVWAFVLAAISWPLYSRLRAALGGRVNVAALLTVTVVAAVLLLPAGIIVSSLAREVGPTYDAFMRHWQSPPALPAVVAQVPGVAEGYRDLQEAIRRGGFLGREILMPLLKPGSLILAGVFRGFLEGGLALFTLFFIFRNGERYTREARAVATHLLGERAVRLAQPMRDALRAVFAGVIGAAVSQGLVAALGYSLVGLKAPALLGVATAVMAMLPFGATLVWIPTSLALILTGSLLQGIVLLAWGFLLVSTVDNFVRPLVISNATRLPYLQTFFAILGGLALFGLLGLFLGPAILAAWLGLWDDWAEAGRQRLGSSLGSS